MINPKISLNRSHIQRRIVRFSADCQLDQIYDRDRLNHKRWAKGPSKRMCGIVGILGTKPVAGQLVDALKRLEYRGNVAPHSREMPQLGGARSIPPSDFVTLIQTRFLRPMLMASMALARASRSAPARAGLY